LTKHGNSLALVIDRAALDLLKIDVDTPLDISTDGQVLVITPVRDKAHRERFKKALESANRRYGRALTGRVSLKGFSFTRVNDEPYSTTLTTSFMDLSFPALGTNLPWRRCLTHIDTEAHLSVRYQVRDPRTPGRTAISAVAAGSCIMRARLGAGWLYLYFFFPLTNGIFFVKIATG
jgi:antitoxin MazE